MCFQELKMRWRNSRLRDPDEVGSISKILKGEYPSLLVRKHLNIGGETYRQITCIERVFMILFLLRTYIDWGYAFRKILKMRSNKERFNKAEPRIIEGYICFRTVLLWLFLFAPFSRTTAFVFGLLIGWELLGLLVHPLRIVFVDRYAYDIKAKRPWLPYSFNRSLLLLLWSYFEMIVGFAYMYHHFDILACTRTCTATSSIGQALYFSVVTITTLGYGDIKPLPGWGRFFASTEAIFGVILIVMVIGLFFVEMGRNSPLNEASVSKNDQETDVPQK